MKKILLIMFLFAGSVHADTILEVGATFLNWHSSDSGAIILAERFAGKYDVGIGLIESQDCKCYDYVSPHYRSSIPPLSTVFVQRVFVGKRFEFGIGFGLFNRASRVSGTILVYPLSIKYRITDRLSIGARHFSNGGSGHPNLGQDLATLSWRFGK